MLYLRVLNYTLVGCPSLQLQPLTLFIWITESGSPLKHNQWPPELVQNSTLLLRQKLSQIPTEILAEKILIK